MRVAETSELNESKPAVSEGTNPPVIELYDRASAPLGQRLCSARETRSWSRADVANRLKLPLKLIERLECDDYEGLTDGVFLRGYLRSYARLVGVSVEQATSVAAAHTQTIPLIATGTISRSRYLFDRYSVSATYLVLTAIIVVPAVWLATHGGLEQNLARTTALDAPTNIVSIPVHEPVPNSSEISAPDNPATEMGVGTTSVTTPAPSVSADPPPVIASMTPFAAAQTPAVAPSPPEVAAAANALGSGAHTLSLKLSQQSWVEITTADGRKLEYSMLAAGSEHSYRSDSQLSVRLGNAQGAQLRTDGAAIDLTPFQRGNVAHVRVFGEAGASVSRIDQ